MEQICYALFRVVLPAKLIQAIDWYRAHEAAAIDREVCSTRDMFQARLDSMLRELMMSGWRTDGAALLTAVLGEIGNNCFDHNLGQWRDVPGCRLGYAAEGESPLFWVVDRGVGLLATLRRADPALTTEKQAIEAAFRRVLSGRTPERRGNGLKFVRSVVNAHRSRGLVCESGDAMAEFGGMVSALAETKERLAAYRAPGVAAVVAWRDD